MLDKTFNSSSTYTVPSVAEIGTGTTAATTSDTSLGNRVPHTRSTADSCDAVTGWTKSGDADDEALNTTAGEFLEGTGCLNLPITYATGTAAWYKNITSINVSSNKYCGLFFYISSKTNLASSSSALTITFGTGGLVNTNYWTWADTDISAGWNFLTFTADDPDGTEGTGADETDVDYVEIKLIITGDFTTNSIRMDDWWYSSEANHEIALESGYPSFDTNNKIVTLRFNLSATEANGFSLGEQKVENTDSSPVQVLRITTDAFTKSTSYEVNYINRIQIDNS